MAWNVKIPLCRLLHGWLLCGICGMTFGDLVWTTWNLHSWKKVWKAGTHVTSKKRGIAGRKWREGKLGLHASLSKVIRDGDFFFESFFVHGLIHEITSTPCRRLDMFAFGWTRTNLRILFFALHLDLLQSTGWASGFYLLISPRVIPSWYRDKSYSSPFYRNFFKETSHHITV